MKTIPAGLLNAVQLVNNVPQPVAISGAEMVDDGGGGALLKVTFPEIKFLMLIHLLKKVEFQIKSQLVHVMVLRAYLRNMIIQN